MIRWVHLATALTPDGDGELRLMQRGAEFSIMLGTNELMNSHLSGSEEALATLSCARLRPGKRPHILIGGLGMGFTLRAALVTLGADAKITLAELVPAIVHWGRGPLSALFDNCLDDPRVSLFEGDVAALIRSEKAHFDAILLDVDNGPDGLTYRENDSLYGGRGLSAAHTALRSGGILAVWSSGPDPGFTQRLNRVGFSVEEVKVRANGKRGGARHVIWLATKK